MSRAWLIGLVPLALFPMQVPEGAMGRVDELPAVVRMSGETEKPRVLLLVRPQILLRRGDVRIEARVSRHADNRRLAIAWTSDVGTAGSTQRPLEGEDAQVLHTLNLPGQPPANYRFVAVVIDRTGKVCARAEAEIHVPDLSGEHP